MSCRPEPPLQTLFLNAKQQVAASPEHSGQAEARTSAEERWAI